jgi:branched-subunit amino acid transport protein
MMGVTFGIRYVLFALAGRVRFAPWLDRALTFVPPAVLTAIIVPAVLIPDGQQLDLSWHNPYLLGAILTITIAYITRNLLQTIGLGMVLFLGLKWWALPLLSSLS